MANYCTKCGRRLNVNGECYHCDKSSNTSQQDNYNQTYNQQNNGVNDGRMNNSAPPMPQSNGNQNNGNVYGTPTANGYSSPYNGYSTQYTNQENINQGQIPAGGIQQGNSIKPSAGNVIKSAFKSLPKSLIKPIHESSVLESNNSAISGLVFMCVKTLALLLVLIIVLSNVSEEVAFYLPTTKIVIYLVFTSLGLDVLFALCLKGFSALASIKITYSGTFLAVGTYSLISTVWMILLALLVYIKLYVVSGFLLSLIMVLLPLIIYAIYDNLCVGDKDNKIRVYAFALGVYYLTYALVTYIFVRSIVETYLRDLPDLIQYFNPNMF